MNKPGLDLIPEVIDKDPLNLLSVKYQGNLLSPGSILKPSNVKTIPYLEWSGEADSLYTICMLDPDVPSRADYRFREFLHWLVVNAPVNLVKKGTTIVEYAGALPSKDTGLHRYVILVYKQKRMITCNERKISSKTAAGRAMFSNKEFARKYKLGPLVAGNIFLSEWDEYVPKLYRRLYFCENREHS